MADAALLLEWYDRHRRVLPWRDGAAGDPYRIWLSEVMLQQTTVAAVGPRYDRFLRRFPGVAALAAAPWEEVAAEWAGLGYYARARNLHAAAKALAAGGFPRTAEGLRALPGIGPYTAAAVAAIAFGEAVVPVDGNVERVVARLHAIATPLPRARAAIARHAAAFMAQPAARARPGDFAQALFDLGATVCTPRRPACALCPWRGPCAAQAQGIQDALPVKPAKAAAPVVHGAHFALLDAQGRLALERRPESGLLGGMPGLPGTPWRAAPWPDAEALAHAPAPAAWTRVPGEARHLFTHRDLRMALWRAEGPCPPGLEAVPLAEAAAILPGAMRRLLELLHEAAPPRRISPKRTEEAP
ncbi:A/G-specific adenine glycosylase [Roseococcus sp. DSY-14]|uniref:A/G-specific adenine glycosylase n=1 Tax=Roseococcus sp. DSY-14 TaxID=3369650 RepID=UPI00387AD168